MVMNILWNIPLFKDVKVPYGNYMSCILGDSHAKMYLAVNISINRFDFIDVTIKLYNSSDFQFGIYYLSFVHILLKIEELKYNRSKVVRENIKILSNQYYSIFLIESQMALILSRLSILSEKSFITERNDDKRYGKLFTSLVDFHYLSCQVI